jgi:predicted flap endonuclease-1-like 5' DNA nuclease
MTKEKLTTEESVINVKDAIRRKLQTVRRAGNFEMFAFSKAQSELAMLLLFKEIKESGEYKGIPYTDENGEEKFTQDITDFCKYIVGESKSSLYEKLQNIKEFGQDFFEKSARLGLGSKDLRLLRQSDDETKQLVINSEAIDLGDKEAVKELFEEVVFKHSTELAAEKKRVEEAEQTVAAVRENANAKQQELDEVKERETKRQFRQKPWERQTLDNVSGMMQAKTLIEQGVNQLSDIYKNISIDGSMEDKALDLIVRSLLSEAQAANVLTYEFTNELIGVFGDKYRPDITATDTFFDLLSEDVTTE